MQAATPEQEIAAGDGASDAPPFSLALSPVERMHRDAKIYTIFEGTSEIQRLVISRAISGMQIR